MVKQANVIEGWVSAGLSIVIKRREKVARSTCIRGLPRDLNLNVNGLLYCPPPPSFSRLTPVHLSRGCIP